MIGQGRSGHPEPAEPAKDLASPPRVAGRPDPSVAALPQDDRIRAEGFVRAARLADVPDGGVLGVSLGTGARRVCLTRLGASVTALDDRCPHAEFALSAGELLADGSVECAWHGARFDRATGAVLQGPACEPVVTHEVLLLDGDVHVRLAP